MGLHRRSPVDLRYRQDDYDGSYALPPIAERFCELVLLQFPRTWALAEAQDGITISEGRKLSVVERARWESRSGRLYHQPYVQKRIAYLREQQQAHNRETKDLGRNILKLIALEAYQAGQLNIATVAARCLFNETQPMNCLLYTSPSPRDS